MDNEGESHSSKETTSSKTSSYENTLACIAFFHTRIEVSINSFGSLLELFSM